MSVYQHAAHLNNEAISSLLSESYQTAVQLLGNSITVMQQELRKLELNMINMESSSPLSSSLVDVSTVEIPMSKQQRSSFIFNQAFYIPEKEGVVRKNIFVNTAAMIFNLAITNHRQYLDNDMSESLMVAEKLYCITLRLLKNHKSCQNSHMGLIMKLACVNNLSSIRFDSYHEVANEVLQSVSNFVSSVGGDNRLFEESKFQTLLINVLLLKAPKVAAAA